MITARQKEDTQCTYNITLTHACTYYGLGCKQCIIPGTTNVQNIL